MTINLFQYVNAPHERKRSEISNIDENDNMWEHRPRLLIEHLNREVFSRMNAPSLGKQNQFWVIVFKHGKKMVIDR